MLNLKRYYVRLRRKNDTTGGYTQWFIDGESDIDAKINARLLFGPNWEVLEVAGPFENLEVSN